MILEPPQRGKERRVIVFAGAVAVIVRVYMAIKAALIAAWGMAKVVLSPIAKVGVEMLMMILKVLLWVLVRLVEAIPADKLGSAVAITIKFLQSLVKHVGEDHPVVQQLSDFSVEAKTPLPVPATKTID